MRACLRWITASILAIVFLLAWQNADAVITAKTPLKAIVGSSTYIFVGKVEKFFPEKPAMVVAITEEIKGKAPFRQLPINCKVADEKAFKANKIEPLLKRFGPDLEMVFFLAPRDGGYITFGFTNGTWFQLEGTLVEKDRAVFSLHSAEPYFRKTFKGTTQEMGKLLKDFFASKTPLPPVDDKAEPGFGPEYAPKKGAGLDRRETLRSFRGLIVMPAGGGLFAVIPTIGLGAPLAILALLFPSIFGGVFVLFRQWMAFITLLSVNSTLLLLQWGFADQLPRGSWWSTPPALWFLMTVSTFLCAVWAWRRQLNALSDGDADAPQKTELSVLAFMSTGCVITTILLWRFTEVRWSDSGWTLTVVMTLGIVAGTLYRCRSAYKEPAPFDSMPIATEGVILAAMLLAQVAFVPAIFGNTVSAAGLTEGKQQTGAIAAEVQKPGSPKWVYTAPENFLGMFASSPVVDGGAVFASFSDALQRGTLVRLDRHTGLQKWAFYGKKPPLRQMISTPCLADGKLYFGEGFHDDQNCHVFCVDADTGAEVWHFKTAGQTESSPAVAQGKVFIGAGNDGVYCLDAKMGTTIWRYPHDDSNQRPLRFGAGMLVSGDRLFCGTGVDRNAVTDKGETAVFCLDAITGKRLWKTAAPFPVWSTPVLKDGLLYITSGNGDVYSDAAAPEKPGGALQCLDAESGNEQWRIAFDNGIIEAPAVDAHRIYFGCRDGNLYCVRRADGKERWRRPLGSPVISTPALDSDPVYERTLGVFATSTAGKVCCLAPDTGEVVWTFVPDQPAVITTSPRLVVTRTAHGYRRQLYFGCGLGGGPNPANLFDNRPVFYCLEDVVNVE
jgi:outer membrane protein assembly factor BamB